MSEFKIRSALITKLIGSSILNIDTSSDIGYDNDDFKPDGKRYFLSVYFLPSDSESMGKSQSIGDENRGLMQISIYTPANSEDIQSLKIADSIRSSFKYGDVATYQDQFVDILDKDTSEGIIEEAWWKRIVSINYLAFSDK